VLRGVVICFPGGTTLVRTLPSLDGVLISPRGELRVVMIAENR
jgi:hypothetical protein